MRLDGSLTEVDLARVPAEAKALEQTGFDGAFSGELARDPFLPLAIAAEHTHRLDLGTSVAIAIPRNPMHVAQTAHDLQAASRGRFILGLGSQVRGHIERRFGLEWSRPTARMREFVLALQAIWRCWNDRTPLGFTGEFYRHTLMTPMFDPGPNPHGRPRIFLAAIGPRMAEVAGEVADGVLLHSFASEHYIRSTMLPALQRGLDASGRGRDEIEVSCPALVVTGATEQTMAEAIEHTRDHIALYGSTPGYRRVLDAHGWGDLQGELNTLLKQDRHGDMRSLISDDIVEAFVVQGTPGEIPAKITARFGDIADRISLRGAPPAFVPDWIQTLRRETRTPTASAGP